MSCRIVAVERRLTAVVKAKVPFAGIPEAQRSARAAIDAALPSLEAGVPGPSCTRFRTPASEALDMEIGLIVEQTFSARDGIVSSELPAGRAAHFLLKGPLEGLPGAWQTLFDWCKAERLELVGINWEIYGGMHEVPANQSSALYALLA